MLKFLKTFAAFFAVLAIAAPVWGQSLADQLYDSVSAQQRAVFDQFEEATGELALSGAIATEARVIAELPDADMAYAVGEGIFLNVETTIDGDLYLFDIGSTGAATQMLPNVFSSKAQIAAGTNRQTPGPEDGITISMSAQSSVQVWMVLLLPTATPFEIAKTGDARAGEIAGGIAGLTSAIDQLLEAGTSLSFALAVFGNTTPPLAPEDVERALGLNFDSSALIQERLNELGFDVGEADGVFGRNTRAGLREWQGRELMDQTGYLNTYTLRKLFAFDN